MANQNHSRSLYSVYKVMWMRRKTQTWTTIKKKMNADKSNKLWEEWREIRLSRQCVAYVNWQIIMICTEVVLLHIRLYFQTHFLSLYLSLFINLFFNLRKRQPLSVDDYAAFAATANVVIIRIMTMLTQICHSLDDHSFNDGDITLCKECKPSNECANENMQQWTFSVLYFRFV